MLREYAFVSATSYNRKSFLQQVNKVFHSSPYYTVVTALDYHQLLCLLCSDFPRSIILEAIKVLDPEPAPAPTESSGEAIDSYKLGILQKAVAVFFYYFGIMGDVKESRIHGKFEDHLPGG